MRSHANSECRLIQYVTIATLRYRCLPTCLLVLLGPRQSYGSIFCARCEHIVEFLNNHKSLLLYFRNCVLSQHALIFLGSSKTS